MYKLLICFSVLITGIVSHSSEFRIDGKFSGVIDFSDEAVEPVKIDLAMQINESRENGEEIYQLEAVLMINEEGGPYTFSTNTFDLEDFKIDLKYFRPGQAGTANFRLVGFIDRHNKFKGDVITNRNGQIGEFEVERVGDYEVLKRNIKYSGEWFGWSKNRDGNETRTRIVVNDSRLDKKNPESFEFETTPGKVASLNWGGTNFSFPQVAIDYLRNIVILNSNATAGGGEFNIEYKLGNDGQFIIGHINSAIRGRAATFKLEKD